MKLVKKTIPRSSLAIAAFVAFILFVLSSMVTQAHPYASGLTNSNGTIRFVLNEGGGTVYVVFDDNTTNTLGVLGKGAQSFPLAGHTGYAIYVTKVGNGTPSQITTDSDTFASWNSPRGIAVNQNPKLGNLFGRTYVGNSASGSKGIGLYALNSDQTEALGKGTTATATPTFSGSGGSGPWRLRVAPDNTLLVDDFSTAAAALWQFQPDLSNSNLVLVAIGQNAGVSTNVHGDMFGTPLMTGSLADGNLVLWTGDSGMAVPAATLSLGPGTHVGDFNCVYRYDIGAGPLPWNNPPNYAYTVGLSGIAELRPEIELGKDGKIIAGFGRSNLSNPDVQILSPDGLTALWDSWHDTGGASDPWRGENSGAATVGGTYCGVRVSPDGRFLASVDINNGVTLALLTNGIPDDGSIFGIPNTPTTGNSRGMDWDAADNVYVVSSGQGLLRGFSLGISTTCISSNDVSGTNGTFQLILPSATASGVATVANASQNYGSPVAGVFRISLNQSTLSLPVTVNFTRGGTAVYTNHYTLNTNETPNGVVIAPNSVTFPAATMPGGGNWTVDIKITPTALPVSTNTLTVVMTVVGGPAYQAVAPVKDTIFIQNTGPQLLLVSDAASGATMYRGVPNDFAKFIITRYGDTNGPGNSLGNVTQRAFTVTNVTYFGTAAFPSDYGARAQRLDPAGNGVVVLPVNGPTAIVFNPGDTAVTCVVGNPVPHNDFSTPVQDVTIIANLTNQVSGAGSTNGLPTPEGFSYNVGTAQVTLTELDNRVGPEKLLYSNPLTNAADSVNWTLTFAGTNFGPNGTPVVIPNYVNDTTYGTNDFFAHFGYDISADSITPSPVMTASNWSGVLKMTVNKNAFVPMGVNVYPQGQNFVGNYALRFNMYLSGYAAALNNPLLATAGREFALFGVNHYGTNCNWRPDATLPAGVMWPTNLDGQWFSVDSGSGSITPADYDLIIPNPLPNNGNPTSGGTPPGTVDKTSATALSNNGIFKHPPFEAMNVTSSTVSNPGGGEPINKWVDVSVEISKQTNLSLFINRSKVLTDTPLTNAAGLSASFTNGTIMLGYDDPNATISDPGSAFVYFSNVRVVELSPFINVQAGLTNSLSPSAIVLQGSSLTFTSSATFATAPITNIWYMGTGAPGTPQTGVPTVALQTNTANATSISSTLTRSFNVIADATNFMSVFSDSAGSVTSIVAGVEVVFGPTNQTVNASSTFQFQVRAAGPQAPTAYQWYYNTSNNLATATKLANSTHFAGVTTTNLFITNVFSADGGIYWAAVTNAAGFVIPSATLTVLTPPPTFTTVAVVGANFVGSFGSTNASDTTNSFILQSAGDVRGPYTNTPATFTVSGGGFQVTSPETGASMFYRLLHK